MEKMGAKEWSAMALMLPSTDTDMIEEDMRRTSQILASLPLHDTTCGPPSR
jgi:hypothetical protein